MADTSARSFLTKINPNDCPDHKGQPRLASEWSGKTLHTSRPRQTTGDQRLSAERRHNPQRGDRLLVWVNEQRGGSGLTATASVIECLEDRRRLAITVGDVALYQPPRLVRGDLDGHDPSSVFEDIKSSTVVPLRFLSEDDRRQLEALAAQKAARTRKSMAAGIAASAEHNGGTGVRGHTDSGSGPTGFIPHRARDELRQAEIEAESTGEFVFRDFEDARRRTMANVARRRGQPAFRAALLRAYGGRCAITQCDAVEVLEAAHIHPYRGDETNHVSNGLLLRADIHMLFDLRLIAVDTTTRQVVIAPLLLKTAYRELAGASLRAPMSRGMTPSIEALDWHRGEAGL